jgi:lysyl-tRNA synthetase class 2
MADTDEAGTTAPRAADEVDEVVPYRVADTTPAGALASGYEALAPGEGSGDVVTVAGRVMRNRPQGKVSFAELFDWSGSVQLFALGSTTPRFAAFTRLSLGDWVAATGEVVRTKRGELSVQVASWSLLAEARRGFGDKWRGVHDVEVRHRQREVDLWANEGVRATFLERAKIVASLRATLADRDFVEVETPVLQPLAGGANARPFVTHYSALHSDVYLRIAPELYLKRLVIGGFERVFEIAKVFRNEGLSPRHNPEFTMLEAYQAYADYNDMAELIEALVAGAARAVHGGTVLTHAGRELDLTPPWRRLTMNEAIAEVTGRTLSIEMGEAALAAAASELGVGDLAGHSAAAILLEIYEKTTEPNLWGPVHVMDYPEEASPLTRAHRSVPGLVERLTPVITGREIAEAYSELIDPVDQRRRLVAQAARRAAGDEEAMVVDEDFLRALEHGMPPTGGIGIGIDRLTMILTDQANIREVLLFPALRPEAGRGADGPEEPDGENPDGEEPDAGEVAGGA